MTFKKCINDGVAAGEITQAKADEVLNLYDELYEQYNKQLGPGPAQSKASIDATAAMKKQVMERKRRMMLQAQTWKQITLDLENYRTPITKQPNKGKAALALFEEDRSSTFRSITQIEKAITRSATRKMDKVLASFRRNLAGKVRNKAQLDNMIREVFVPGSTKDASARELAQGWQEAAEYLRKRFNAAGGAIPKRSDWGMPQQHHSLKVRQAGFEAWRDTITQCLTWRK